VAVVKDGIVQKHSEEELQGRGETVRNVSQVILQSSVGNHGGRNAHQLIDDHD